MMLQLEKKKPGVHPSLTAVSFGMKKEGPIRFQVFLMAGFYCHYLYITEARRKPGGNSSQRDVVECFSLLLRVLQQPPKCLTEPEHSQGFICFMIRNPLNSLRITS